MARRGSKTAAQQARTQQERARVYRARAQWNADRKTRRVRDNVVASLAGALIVIGCFVSQAVHASVEVPEPEPVPSPSIDPVPSPEVETEPDTDDEDPDADEDSADDPQENPTDEETPAP